MEPDAGDTSRFWSSFARDPRVSANQGLRAGDRDRDLVRDLISESYADGRLTQEEMDLRLTRVFDAKALGDLLPVVADLIPLSEAAPRPGSSLVGPEEIERLARVRYAERRRQALAGMLVPSLICLIIWIWSMINTGGAVFPWPIFVILGTGGYLSRLVFGRESALEEERDRLRKKQARELARGQHTEADDGRPALDADLGNGRDDGRADRPDPEQDDGQDRR